MPYNKNILLASFAQSVGQVMDPRFFLPCFHGPRASAIKGRKNSVHNLLYGPRTRLIRGMYTVHVPLRPVKIKYPSLLSVHTDFSQRIDFLKSLNQANV